MIQTLDINWPNGIVVGGTHPYACTCYLCRGSTWHPLQEYKGPQHDFWFDIEMPGTKKESISVKQKGGIINIAWDSRLGERKTQSLPIGTKYYDMEKLSVTYRDGLLKIHCPLKAEFPPEPPQEPEIDIEIK
jgi:HSP20 family molecular chaperone IbpA